MSTENSGITMLTPQNAKDVYLSWKNAVLMNIRAIVPPKGYIGTINNDKKLIPVLKCEDHLFTEIPLPKEENYGDLESFIIAHQRWNAMEGSIQKILALSVSEELRPLVMDSPR